MYQFRHFQKTVVTATATKIDLPAGSKNIVVNAPSGVAWSFSSEETLASTGIPVASGGSYTLEGPFIRGFIWVYQTSGSDALFDIGFEAEV